ncbi:hypothetical protein V6N13_064071 [Hibiscus sabdariffa]|uniref:Uncharacterized protein n=1 Tax=Hibiscus sabdariffa TaxID=183260 RepID=A0ABR2R202_9ROSI
MAWTSRGTKDTGRGDQSANPWKLRIAEFPLILKATTSCARAATFGVGKVTSPMRDILRGSQISDTHLPNFTFRCRDKCDCLILLFSSSLQISNTHSPQKMENSNVSDCSCVGLGGKMGNY